MLVTKWLYNIISLQFLIASLNCLVKSSMSMHVSIGNVLRECDGRAACILVYLGLG